MDSDDLTLNLMEDEIQEARNQIDRIHSEKEDLEQVIKKHQHVIHVLERIRADYVNLKREGRK